MKQPLALILEAGLNKKYANYKTMSEKEQNKSVETSENPVRKKQLWEYGLLPAVLAGILLISLLPKKGQAQESAEIPASADFEVNLPEMDIKITWNVSEANLVGLLEKYTMAFYAPTHETYQSPYEGAWNLFSFKSKEISEVVFWDKEFASKKETGRRLTLELEKTATELQGLERTDPDYFDSRKKERSLKGEISKLAHEIISRERYEDEVKKLFLKQIGPSYGDLPDELRKALNAAIPPTFGGKVDQGMLLLGGALLVANDAVTNFAAKSGKQAAECPYVVSLVFTQNGEVIADSVKEKLEP